MPRAGWVAEMTQRTGLTSRGRAAAIWAVFLLSCAGARPDDLGVRGSVLGPCPGPPHCVSSDAADSSHRVPAFELAAPAPEAWRVAREAVADLPRTRIITATPDYLHAECSSAIFGFVDDLELQLRTDQGLIAVRSSSRVGYGDMGVNRRRVEELHARLVEQGVVR